MINRLQIGCMRTYFITVRLVRFASYSIAKYLIRYTRSYEACVARLQNQIMKFWVLRSLRSLFPDPSDNQLVVRCFWWNLQANYTRTQVLLTHSRKAGRRNLRNCPSLPPSSAILSFDVRKHFLEIHLETKQNQSLLCCTPTYSFHFFVICNHVPHKWARSPALKLRETQPPPLATRWILSTESSPH